MNPLNTLIVKIVEPCNCGGYIALGFWHNVIHIPVRPHFQSTRKNIGRKKSQGISDNLSISIKQIAQQDSNLGILAKAIIQLTNTSKEANNG